MSSSVRERITTHLQAIQQTGGDRLQRIRAIVREAVAQSVQELKAGADDVRPIVKEAVMAVVDAAQPQSESVVEDLAVSIDGALDGVRDANPDAMPQAEAEAQQIQSEITAIVLSPDAVPVVSTAEAADSGAANEPTLRELLLRLVAVLRQRSWVELKQLFARAKQRWTVVDEKLENRYGDRYTRTKQSVEQMKTAYNATKDQIKTGEPSPVEGVYEQVDDRATQAGKTAAKVETALRQRLKTLLQSAAEKL
ncbi:MAG: hypothetical protein VKK04_16200 [Synechococcales bacterium]|nr:hypothetical protein [Synechococcales bacterium]